MAIEHSAIADGERHEPKGADSATSGQVYVSDGANSGTWKNRTDTLTGFIADASTAETVYLAVPFAGTVTDIYSVIDGAIGTADAVLTAKINGTAITGGTVTIAYSGSAAGDVDSDATITGANTLAAGDYITVDNVGTTTTGSVKINFTILISRTT